MTGAAGPGAFGVLFVCTGNLHRSPIAERLLAAALPASGYRVTSAGTAAQPAVLDPATRSVIAALGGREGGFTARRLTADLVAGADLVLGLERAHREAAVRLCPLAMRRCFTLKEFNRLSARAGSAGSAAGAVALAASRRGALAVVPPDGDGIGDPYGQPYEVLRTRALEIREAVLALAVALDPSLRKVCP
ncbi:low molecular weight phosphatase family protein [Streptomyces sp. NPDC001941]|uniref:arsenate reductase/protein-tyrosine-phosphatase family protein n=1 Tax=Streptomyces sp. NPDC001941 TaxID=3154659 RepID=UPI003330D680